MGDLDSISQDALKFFKEGTNINVYPREKDETDGQIAVDLALQSNCSEIYIFGAIGERMDHVLANIGLLNMILEYGDKAWVLYAGNHNILTETYVNYNTYYEHLKFCKERGLKIYDQFGTIGDLSKDNPRLGLHEFKKKFGGDYIEFMGEFDYVIKPVYYFLFTKLVPIYRNIVKKKNKKELKNTVNKKR